eukprot:CAMPEP_0116011042 /NCGR_PEP_ID=MMETSP0321-20121206/4344_1 /TAXON_ID=163516 /ORGANISM="Leptocylindrus danicus var. danicus, Strain B650" /LENGTH=216 /DNA_ID=CAMNT_0003480223 /DNA_START=1 /DNA_END=652 /DNA_ORIENTATION=+
MDNKSEQTTAIMKQEQAADADPKQELLARNNNSQPSAHTETNGSTSTPASTAPPLPETVKMGIHGGLIISFVIMCVLLLSAYISKGQHQEILQRASALIDAKKAGLQSALITSIQEKHASEIGILRRDFDGYKEIMTKRLDQYKVMSDDLKAAKDGEQKCVAESIKMEADFESHRDLLFTERKRSAELGVLVQKLQTEIAELQEEEEEDDDKEDEE